LAPAGKSTLLQLATGQFYPAMAVRAWPDGMEFVAQPSGLCPEQDAFYEWMTGCDFVYTSARLTGQLPSGSQATTRTIGRSA
jgi:ABC-2 type transport system ATP-binding protein